MKTVGFVGAYDKSNLIMYIAKALTWQDKKVLVVDATRLQKMKYLVPNINSTSPCISEFEDIDFAIGFVSIAILEKYLGKKMSLMPYDYMLVDVDTGKEALNYNIPEFDKNYFVTAFDMYSLNKGLEIFNILKEPVEMTKVLCRTIVVDGDEDYLNYLSMEKRIVWKDKSIYIPNDGDVIQNIEENQKVSRIRMKKMPKEYQKGILTMVQDIMEEPNQNKIKRNIMV